MRCTEVRIDRLLNEDFLPATPVKEDCSELKVESNRRISYLAVAWRYLHKIASIRKCLRVAQIVRPCLYNTSKSIAYIHTEVKA